MRFVGFEEIYDLPIKALEISWGESLPNHNEKWGFKKIKTLVIENVALDLISVTPVIVKKG